MPPAHVSSSVPPTQNTAPILEFRCLFTPDLKKKQKKWQDGRLKFHTFNKRIMVYDDRTNYVGDTHYHTTSLEEGEELELERGVLVEVGELLGKQDQDLGEILESVRGTAKSARQASIAPERGAGRGTTLAPSSKRYATPAPAARQMSMLPSGPIRPLSALLGTPSGHHGRALLPTTSPFEERQNRLASETPEPASKRRKVDSAPGAQPLWARTSLMQSTSRRENAPSIGKPVARELSYPDSIAPKTPVKKTLEKPNKSGYAQKLTGAVLNLSSTQKANAYNGRQSINLEASDDENDDDVTITSIRERAVAPPILPPVKRLPAPIPPPKKPAEIVYPDSIAPKAKPRKTVEKSSKAGYAEKLTGAALNLSSSNMANMQKRQQSIRPAPSDDEINDDMEVTVKSIPRVETPILPPQLKRKSAPILPPTAAREIVYPESLAPKSKPRKTFEKKSKAGYAEKLTGAALNLSGAPAASSKRNQPTQEEEELLARLAELRAHREAAEDAEVVVSEVEAGASKAKKARISEAKRPPADMSHEFEKENDGGLFVHDDFVDIDAVVPPLPATKAAKPKKPKVPRKKKQADVSQVESCDHGTTKEVSAFTMPSSKPRERSLPIRDAAQGRSMEDASNEATGTDRTSQASLPATGGSLRIKVKPKRKLLMMQSIPAKPVATSASIPPPKPPILPGASLPPAKQAPPEASQATKTLTEFHDKQKEKLEERRRRIEAKKRVPIEIHSSPEPGPECGEMMEDPPSLINLDEEEWINPNASKGMDMLSNVAAGAGSEVPVPPTPYAVQSPNATPSTPQTTNRSKSLTIEALENDARHEPEEIAITYTAIDELLRPQIQSPLFCRTVTASAGLVGHSEQEKLSMPAPHSSLPQSSPAFTQQKVRVKRPLPDFSAASKSTLALTKSSLRKPPVPLFNSTEDEEPQSSLFVRQGSPERIPPGSSEPALSVDGRTAAEAAHSSDDGDDQSQPIRAACRVRQAQASRQGSPDRPSDGSGSETEEPSPQSKATSARPVVDSLDSMAWPESQAEEGGFSSSPPPGPRMRELSAADEERLANGHCVLVKIKSGIRSKEIIRPKSVSMIKTVDENPFFGFARPHQPIVRSRTGSFIEIETYEGPESEDDVDEDEVMIDLEAQAKEERQAARRREEAQRRTREFREKKERERLTMESMKETERKRSEAAAQDEEDQRKKDQAISLELERQEKARLAEEARQAQEEAERLQQQQDALDAQTKLDEEKRLQQQRGALDAQTKIGEEKRLQQQRDALDAQKKLDEQIRYDEMRLKLQQEIESQMQEKYRAMEEELRLKLEAQTERERLDKQRQEKADAERLEHLRVKEQNEARQRAIDAKKLEDDRLSDLADRENREAEQLKWKQVADQARQQRAVEAAAAELASSASSLPRSLSSALQGFRADEAQSEKEKTTRQAEYPKRVNTSFGSMNGNNTIEHIDIAHAGSFGEGDLILAQPKVTAFKMPSARSQAAMQPQAPRPVAAMTPNRSFHGFPTHIHAAMYANNIVTGSHDFAPTFQCTPPAVGYKVPSTLHLSAPAQKPFCKPRFVPIVPKKAVKTMKDIRDEKRAERDQREDLKIYPGFEEKGEILTWETGAWTAEARDLFDWRPKAVELEDDWV